MDIKSEVEFGARVLIWSGAAYAGYRLVKVGIDAGIRFFSPLQQNQVLSEIRLQGQELTAVVNELEEIVAEGEAVLAYAREGVDRWERILERDESEHGISHLSKI